MNSTQQQRKMAACSYLWVLSFVVAYKYRHDSFVFGHAKQGMFLTIVSAIVLFIPLEVLVIVLELLFVLLAVMGFYRAYQGEPFQIIGEGGIGLHFRSEDWNIGELNSYEQTTRAEQERAAVAYIPFLSLWFLWRVEGNRFVRIHSLYALWIQLLGCFLGVAFVLPGQLIALCIAICSVYGVVLALQGTWDIFPQSMGWVRRYQSFYAPWYLFLAICLYIWNRITEQKVEVLHSLPELYQISERRHLQLVSLINTRVHTNQSTEPVWQYLAYVLGVFVLLIQRNPLLLHHGLHGTVLLLIVGVSIFLNSAPLLYLTAVVFVWFVLQIRSNTIIVLPGLHFLELRLLSTLFPTSHE